MFSSHPSIKKLASKVTKNGANLLEVASPLLDFFNLSTRFLSRL
jgi:hypothetical protein